MRVLLVLLLLAGAAVPQEPAKLRAYVWEYADPWTKLEGAAGDALREAGFDVRPLPLDKDPRELLDAQLIFLGSFVSEHPGYAAYMKRYAAGLYHFVDKGNVVVQMTQADQTEAKPPFLPTTQAATRADADFAKFRVLSPEHPLVAGVEAVDGFVQLDKSSTIWEAFTDFGGFEVILAADEEAQWPALMEGAYGQGRIVLVAMAFDKGTARGGATDDAHAAARAAFTKRFFANLARHVGNVRDRKTAALRITVSPRRANAYVTGSWTLAVLPDTQVYSLRLPGLFLTQTSWLAQERDSLDLRYVIHLGDIVNNNTAREWENAHRAMSLLHGRVPYALVPGNHDYGPSGDASTRDTGLNEHFDFARTAEWPTFGGAMERGRLDNTFHLFEAGGRKWIVVCLEWGPRDGTIAWADGVMRRHPDRLGILVTHAYLNNNDHRYDHTDKERPQHYNPHHYRTPGGVNDGEELWRKLVRRHRFAFALNGHVLGDGTGYRADRTERGNVCHQILANYQMRELGGEAYLRLLEFRPDGKTVRVKAYSPLHDKYLTAPDQSFTLTLDDGPR
jgi:hypothetical protein